MINTYELIALLPPREVVVATAADGTKFTMTVGGAK